MKILKYILGALAVLILLFLAVGFIVPEIDYDAQVKVDKPIQEAWAVMNDPDKTTEWLKDIKSREHVGGNPGQVGGVTKYVFETDGQQSEIIETITAVDQGKSMSMDFVMEGAMTMNYTVDFTSTNDGTLIASKTTTTGDGLFMKSLLPLMKGIMIDQEMENLNNLKKVVEMNTKVY